MSYNPERPWDTDTTRTQLKRVTFYIAYNPWQSATQIAKALNLKPGVVSGTLKLLTEKRQLVRKPGCGPRGGFGYWLADPPPDANAPTWHDRILRELDAP